MPGAFNWTQVASSFDFSSFSLVYVLPKQVYYKPEFDLVKFAQADLPCMTEVLYSPMKAATWSTAWALSGVTTVGQSKSDV